MTDDTEGTDWEQRLQEAFIDGIAAKCAPVAAE